jgi:3-phosphoinositide dependent protein kinase-1
LKLKRYLLVNRLLLKYRISNDWIYQEVLDKKQIVKEKKTKYVGIEKQVLQQCQDHPLIVTLFYTFQDTNSLYFVLELAPNGNLLEYLQRNGILDVSTARFYIAEICIAVAYLHDNCILHRDLKPEI